MTKTILATLFVAMTLMVGATGLQESFAEELTINGTNYQSGITEIVNATFAVPDGGDTLESYSGLVLLTVSGIGESLATSDNDAFYLFENRFGNAITPRNDPLHYQLTYDASHLLGGPAFIAKNSIVFDVDAGVNATSPYVPAYREDHTYTFVVNTGLVGSSVLHFGVSDGIFSDNTGAYNIEVTQLEVTVDEKNNPCDALDKAESKGKGQHKGIKNAKANNGC